MQLIELAESVVIWGRSVHDWLCVFIPFRSSTYKYPLGGLTCGLIG